MSELFRLESADNFRDLAGADGGYPTRDGRRVRPGLVFRSNELQLTDDEVLTLTGLGLTAIHDLRTPDEVGAHPDAVLPGADWRHVEVPGIPVDEVAGLERRRDAVDLMGRVYRGFVDDGQARAAFARLLTDLADAEGPQLVHCTAGKDRTGWAAALLLHVAGVPEDTIVADYLLTNDYSESSRARYTTMVEAALGPEMVPVYEPLMVADAAYLRTACAEAAHAYGDLDGYLHEGLGLTREIVQRLRDRLTGLPTT